MYSDFKFVVFVLVTSNGDMSLSGYNLSALAATKRHTLIESTKTSQRYE